MATERSSSQTGRGGLTNPLCAFWLGGRCLGLDVSLVGEVVALAGTTPVPRANPAVRGIFNLRGAPVVVLDLARVLDLGDGGSAAHGVGLLLRTNEIVAAGEIERVEAVIPAGRGEFVDRDAAGDHPAVRGFLDDRAHGGHVVTVVDAEALVQRLKALRYLDDVGD
jgi:chemotaxis signal transduction protein